MRCRTARILMVTSEASASTRRRLERHLEGCAACRREAAAAGEVLTALAMLPLEAPVPPHVEQEVWRRIRAEADAEPARRRTRWTALGPALPALATAAVVVVGVVLARTALRNPDVAVVAQHDLAVARRAKHPVPSDPPPDLAAQPDLFVDLPIVRNLDKLRHFDTIAAMDGDDADPSDEGGQEHPNG